MTFLQFMGEGVFHTIIDTDNISNEFNAMDHSKKFYRKECHFNREMTDKFNFLSFTGEGGRFWIKY